MLIQMRCDGKPADNLDHALELIKLAHEKGAELIVLPVSFSYDNCH